VTYGIIFWSNSSDRSKIFRLQKKVIIIMADVQKRESCKELFKNFHLLPIASKYLLAVITFIIGNIEMFQTNPEVHAVSMRQKRNRHRQTAILIAILIQSTHSHPISLTYILIISFYLCLGLPSGILF
jgi:hypothetical protein